MTTPTQPHTQPPWIWYHGTTDNGRRYTGISRAGRPYCDDVLGFRGFLEEDDAEFACHAVNHHHALVEALSDCIESLERLQDAEGAYRITCIQQARALLAKVKGGHP